MDITKKATLINAAWGGWYPRGAERLKRSLIYHGWNYDMHFWTDQAINRYFHPAYPYRIKMAAIHEAVQLGYTHIIWMDCSLWVNQDPNPLMAIIDDEGGLFIRSGYDLAQTSADTDLIWAEASRDEAEKLPELWSCIFGINLENPKGHKFLNQLYSAYHAGVFDTPRMHSGRSEDPRFLHARQDQTAVSWAYHKAGFDNVREPHTILTNYTERQNAPDALVFMRGM